MTAAPFPILLLPSSALQDSLKQMSLVEHVSLSVLSNNTKQLIKSFAGKIYNIEISVKELISINLFAKQSNFALKLDQFSLEIRNHSNLEITLLNVPGFTVKEWIEHLAYVFSENRGVRLEIEATARKSIEEIHNDLGKLKIVSLQVEASDIQNCELLKLFPSLAELSVNDGTLRKSIVAQNFEEVSLHTMRLDEILLSNSLDLELYDHTITDKEMNILMRLWMEGSHPRRHSFICDFRLRQLDETVIFKSINYSLIEEEPDENNKKFQIRRYDGAEAFIQLQESIHTITFSIYVPNCD